MFLSDTALRKPVLTLVGLIMLTIFGLLAFRTVGVDLIPEVNIPYVSVLVVYPGASPEEIETSVAKRVEDAVVQVNGIKHVTATCANNFAQVMVEFEMGRDVDKAATDIREKIDLIRKDLPDGAEDPQVLKFDMNAIPVVTVAITGDLPTGELYDFADDRLKARFSTVDGVASVELIGGEEREVVVSVDRERLAAAGLTLAQVVEKVGKGNLKIPSGQVDDSRREFSVMFDAEASAMERLGEIELTPDARRDAKDVARIYLRDVATFAFGTKRAESLGRYDGEPAIVCKITKRGEANAAKTVAGIRKAYGEIARDLPGGVKLHWVKDDGTYIDAIVRGGMDSIWQGVLLTGFILLVFLADWRTAFAAFVSIPLTIVISLIAFSLFGYTVNIITMNAVGISVGILVANSIVVLENVALRLAQGGEKKATVAAATGEIAIAVVASALTNVVVFLPMATMKSMAGQFFVPFAIVVTASTLASLLVSFTLTPMMAAKFAGRGEAANRLLGKVLKPWDLCYRALERTYAVTLGAVVRHPWLFVILFTALTLLGFRLVTPQIKSDFVPTIDKEEVRVKLEFPADYTLERTGERTQAIAKRFEKLNDSAGNPLVRHWFATIGKTQGILGQVANGSYLSEITAVLSPMDGRADDIEHVMGFFRKATANEPDVIVSTMVPVVVGGAAQKVQLKIAGDDLGELNRIGVAAAKELAVDPTATDVSHSVRPGKPEVRIRPNRAVLSDLGLTPYVLGLNLRAALSGLTPATFTRGDRSYDVRVRYAQVEGLDQIEEMNFPGPEGRPFLLGSVAELERTMQQVQIVRSEKRRSVIVYANNAAGRGLGETLAAADRIVKPKLPRGYASMVGGMAEYMGETFEEFGLVSAVAIVLAYLLMCAIMESWLKPFVIMFTIPFSYLGMFIAVVATDTTLSIFGLLAGIMLVGVVVNAAILFMDEYGRTGDILGAAQAKFRPILMSCAAALFGMLPMAVGGGLGSELRQSMGIGAVGGMLVSTVISLYFIPALCALWQPRDGISAAANLRKRT